MIEHLPGMFAFGMWDDEKQELFCARDRFGEKPFYYAIGKNGEFVFASEIKAILASNLVEPVLDYEQLWRFLKYSYVYPTRTIYSNIHTLPPAHTLVYANGAIKVERYYHLPTENTKITEHEAVEEFRRLFRQAVRRQLVADVPVAAFLSGGLDSGSVVAVASEMMPQLTTISFAFREGKDESFIARTMAKRYRTNHIELLDLDADISGMLEKMQSIFDEPFGDPAAIPAYYMSKAAREHAVVVITGDAGDELVGGYESRYNLLAYIKQMRHSAIPIELLRKYLWYDKKVRDKVRSILLKRGITNQNMLDLQDRGYSDVLRRLSASYQLNDDIKNSAQWNRSRYFATEDADLDALGLHSSTISYDYLITDGFLSGEALDNAIRGDIHDYLPGDGFVKTDRTAMAVSLESRTPFCDKDLSDFCISLPFSMKVRGNKNKYILRKAFADKWTPPVKRGVKNGLGAPFWKWLEDEKVVEMKQYYLSDKGRRVFDILPYDVVQGMMQTKGSSWAAWCLLQFSMWLESHPCNLYPRIQ